MLIQYFQITEQCRDKHALKKLTTTKPRCLRYIQIQSPTAGAKETTSYHGRVFCTIKGPARTRI